MSRLLTVCVLGLMAGASAEFDFPPFNMRNYEETAVGPAVDLASSKLLREAVLEKPGENVVMSPLGVMVLLSLYSTGTEGVLRDDIAHLLGGDSTNYTELIKSYTAASERLGNQKGDHLTLANKIYVAEGAEITDNFKSSAKSFQSEVEALSFQDTSAAADVINQWAEAKTKGHIKNAVTKDVLSQDVVAALFNVIYFQGKWHVPFEASDTTEKDFYVTKDKTVKKPMMKLEQSLFYTTSTALDAQLVELPYKEEGFRMVIVLPNQKDGLSDLIEKVSKHGLYEDIKQLAPAGANIDLLLPRFDIESKLDLNGLLTKLGLSKLFTEPASNIIKGAPVTVSKAFQKAFIKVDEKGATAGAFTGLVLVPLSYPPPPPRVVPFHADHPFLFAILHQDTVLFEGVYSK